MNYLKLREGKQHELIIKAIDRIGSERKLCKILNVSKGTIYRYKFELGNMSQAKFKKILSLINADSEGWEAHIMEKLQQNWGRIKGGINCVARKKGNGTFPETIERLRKVSSKRMRQWHKEMKRHFPREYHIKQYERFKKVRRSYTCKLSNGVLVRNDLERKIGNFLISQNISFEYEPYLSANGNAYFPDFKVHNIIVEATEWKHPSSRRICRLMKKIKDYQNSGFKVVLFIPNNLRNFYKELDSHIISTLAELKHILMPL